MILTLTDDEARALRSLVDTYLASDGPAFECMPDWDEGHTAESLAALRETVLAQIPARLP